MQDRRTIRTVADQWISGRAGARLLVPRTVLLIDGNSLTYRAFFALPTDMATASGQVTNAVFGFTSMLINLLRDHEARRHRGGLRLPEPTFRHERVSTYKGARDWRPTSCASRWASCARWSRRLRSRSSRRPGYEADDVIATLATQARDRATTS